MLCDAMLGCGQNLRRLGDGHVTEIDLLWVFAGRLNLQLLPKEKLLQDAMKAICRSMRSERRTEKIAPRQAGACLRQGLDNRQALRDDHSKWQRQTRIYTPEKFDRSTTGSKSLWSPISNISEGIRLPWSFACSDSCVCDTVFLDTPAPGMAVTSRGLGANNMIIDLHSKACSVIQQGKCCQ